MQPFTLISAIVATYMCKVDGQQTCNLPNSNGQGTCIELFNCPPLSSLLSNPNRSQQDVDLLKKAHCGFSGRTPLVCCPCTTPEGQSGQCINIYSCPSVVNRLRPPVSQAAVQYVQKSRCNGVDNMSVCCSDTATSEPATPAPTREPGECTLRAEPPSPTSGCCGVESNTGDRIFGGNATNIDEYPWLVAIEYQKNNKIKILCGGTLISGRYVLTAGHCISGPILNAGSPINVRLGDYDITNNGADCTIISGGGTDCTDGAIVVPIETTIPHPGYNSNSNMRRHDIGLIKLASTAPFTDFIRPICLPATDVTPNLPPGAKLWVAGWGAVDDRHSASAKKQHVDLPYLSATECQPSYTVPGRNVPLWRGQLCAGGEKNKDSCKGDSGGPLMYITTGPQSKPTEIVGVVSFGPTPCGLEDIPGVYTKVFEYDNWIRRTMVD